MAAQPILQFSPTRFPAAIVRSRTIGAFVMTETDYASEAALPRHAHEYACVVVVLRGAFRERFESDERAGEPGMIIVRPEGEAHSDRFERSGGRCLNIELPPEWTSRVRMRSSSFATPTFRVLGRRLHDELANPDDVSPLAVESLLLTIFTDAARAERRASGMPPAWLARVKQRLHNDRTFRVSLDELAASAGVHPVHLATTFRRYFGQSVASYVRQLRIDYACRALAESNAALAEIALDAGFSDQSHFGRAFKRAMRMTPAEYRQNVLTP
ncbi:MAG TPA: AraC family transcriptional regulator [Thermoanaerobaculia bacterium]|nr:AraC family transcriptional regulator [Thermoanaerobaculia bacterium]